MPKKWWNRFLFSSLTTSNPLLFRSISCSSWARWAQALCPGFWSWPVWWTRSSGGQSQKLILQLVVLLYVLWYSNNSLCLELHSRQPELGSWIWNPLYCHGDCTTCFLAWDQDIPVSRFKILVETGTTRPSRIRLNHGRYQADTRVGNFISLWTNTIGLKINEQSCSESHGNFETTPRSCCD